MAAPSGPGFAPAAAPQAAAPATPPAAPAPPPEEDHGSWYEALDLSAFVDAYYSLNFNSPKPQSDANAFHAFDRAAGFGLSWVGLDVAYTAEEVGATVNLRFGPAANELAGHRLDTAANPFLSRPDGATQNAAQNQSVNGASGSDAQNGLQFVKQAYATWRPGFAKSHLSFDFGKFDTIYGVEFADSQKNINYTRGFLYTLAQPHFHTGLRATYYYEGFSATGLVVNGWNDSIDKNFGKGFGVDLGYTVKRSDGSGNLLTVKAGYFLSPESLDYYTGKPCDPGTVAAPYGPDACVPGTPGQGSPVYTDDRADSDTKNLRHFVDLSVLFEPIDELLVTLNGDFGYDSRGVQDNLGTATHNSEWFGISLAGRYRLTDMWALGLRGEYLADGNGALCDQSETELWIDNPKLPIVGACHAAMLTRGVASFNDSPTSNTVGFASGTATIEVAPVTHLLLRLDGRYDHASEDVFPLIRTRTASQGTITLGVVATTD